MYVRPHLDNRDVIYNTPFVANEFDSWITLSSSMERLEKVQYQAALAVTSCWQGTNCNKLYDVLGWETQAHRRWAWRLFHIFIVISTKYPAYLYEVVPYLLDCYPFMVLVGRKLAMRFDATKTNTGVVSSQTLSKHGIILLMIFVPVHQ